MNAQKFTQKSLEIIQDAQNCAVTHENQQIEQEHLLYALLHQDGGLIPQLLTLMKVDASAAARESEVLVNRLPAVTGSGRENGKVYVSADVDRNLADAEAKAAQMKDEFVSVEHLMLAILDRPNARVIEFFKS